ncbi:MAG TPA: hypothetical protein VFE32_14845 [Puia sp.]|jgi:hypothetical protein|nr:hypothetical protein [Puia sp.]
MTREYIIDFFKQLTHETKGFEGWLNVSGPPEVFERLSRIEREPLTKVQLNQLLLLSLEAGISDDFFEYYWLQAPIHSYDVKKVDDYRLEYVGQSSIISLAHLRWGLKRIYIDGLLYFGSIKHGFKELKTKSHSHLINFFKSKSVPTEIIKKRGRPLEFIEIAKDERYLISEMACKTYGETPKTASDLKSFLIGGYQAARSAGITQVKIKDLFDKDFAKNHRQKHQASLGLLQFSVDEIVEEIINSEKDIEDRYQIVAEKFLNSRGAALKNTELYLSLVNDLDVYVATSMRTRKDFRDMADACETIFKDSRLRDLHLRYFDPTITAADGHEDKGLIECLMVKCAKVLVYCAGEKESYGKDSEAAMALSLGKPVIFYCNPQTRADFYKSVHPLSRLIDFSTGVAVGAIVTEKIQDVSELLSRIFENKMEYDTNLNNRKRVIIN